MKKMLMSVALVLCMTSLAFSNVAAYDTFSYTPGGVFGNSTPAFGFVGAWGSGGGNPAQGTVESASLIYGGATASLQSVSGMLQVIVPNFDGGRVGRFVNTDPNGPFAGYVNANGKIGKPGQAIYISFLMRTSVTTPFYAFELKRGDLGDNGGILYIGNDMGGSNLQVCAYRNRDTSAGNMGRQFQWLGAATTDTELFVIRIDYGTASDNVTVHRNPSLEAEPVIAPQLVNAGFLDFDAVTMAAWVGPGGRVAQFDEVCIASTYAEAVRFYSKPSMAQNPAPANAATGIQGAPGVTLSWQAGTGVTPTGYKVYFSDVLGDVLAENAAAYQGTTTGTTLTIGAINTDAAYYWCVNEIVADANDILGTIWTFKTIETFPEFQTQPASQQVFAGETVSFTVDVASMTPEEYRWFNTAGELADGGSFSGTKTPTLVITNAQVAHESGYYCKVTNTVGTVSSNTANLLIKRVVGDWTLNGSDPNVAWQDFSGSENHLKPVYTVPGAFTWTQGADGTANGALVFNGQFALGTKKLDGTMNAIPVGDTPYTIIAWAKPNSGDNRGVVGWGNYGFTNQVNAVKLNDNGSTVWHYWWGADVGGNRGYSMIDNIWHLVTVTYDGDVRAVYIDGIQAGRDNPVAHLVSTSANFLIGKTNTTAPDVEFFDGALDDVKVYNYALTAIEIAQAYTNVLGGELCVVRPTYDVDGDCRVNLTDLASLATEWLKCGLVPTCLN